MKTLSFLVKEAQCDNPEAMLEQKIKRELHQMTYEEREDLAQVLRLKVIEAVRNYDFHQTAGWDFVRQIEISNDNHTIHSAG